MRKTLVKMNVILLTIIAVSCKSDVELGVTGIYSIDKIFYKGRNITYEILGNGLEFKGDNTCDLTATRTISDLNVRAERGTWSIYESDSTGDYRIKIKTDNEIYRGDHRIRFVNDKKNRLLLLVIESDNLYAVCRKGLLHYESNRGFIKRLVQMTN